MKSEFLKIPPPCYRLKIICLSSAGDVLKETSSQSKVQKSLQKDAREAINRRINQDPDFDGKKFPYAKDFKNSK